MEKRSTVLMPEDEIPAPAGTYNPANRRDGILPTGGYLLGSAPLAVPPCLPEDGENGGEMGGTGGSMDALRTGLLSGLSGKKVY